MRLRTPRHCTRCRRSRRRKGSRAGARRFPDRRRPPNTIPGGPAPGFAGRSARPHGAIGARFSGNISVYADRQDRSRNLRTRALPVSQQRPGRQPDTETELLLVDICRELFDRRDISAADDFFELGGDSLLAAVVAARVHGAIGVELNLGMFAEHPRLGALAANLERLRHDDGVKEEPLVRVWRDAPLPLSFAQERAWRASQTHDGLRGYVHSNRYRFVGPLDREILRDCMSLLVKRHESLRTTFAVLDGKPVQIIHPPAPVALPFFDLVGSRGMEKKADHIFQMEAARPIHIGKLPLMRFALIRVRNNEHWLQRVRDRIISDGWSSQIFFDELSLLYAAKRRGETPALPEFQNLQYADYAVWERKALRPDGPAFRAAVDWWKSIVAKPPAVLRLPCRRSPETPSSRSFCGGGGLCQDLVGRARGSDHAERRIDPLGPRRQNIAAPGPYWSNGGRNVFRIAACGLRRAAGFRNQRARYS